ncbi:ATP-dependent RecD-like DNA helicase [Sporolactobacillus sp. CQH2019]|uniref:SF1B family DNA helicase RecD2 n=1 Tax=Sporolactobacillus sp. CQH2019 TaxID=3023512 RepID=UPI002368D7D4|nr:ATP-dependent RecD-like DNA helicase [Sporolactobacillus sp. CQH2019]MDD9147643.1 ATP-dependent RecD-like DNA helicase [Sporolactobacillus sp. CQH2019]
MPQKIFIKERTAGIMEQAALDLFSDRHPSIKGEPVRIVFQNKENGYTVMIVKINETDEPVQGKEMTIVGYFPAVHLHETYQFIGRLKTHPKYGQQYEAERYRKLLPQSRTGMVQYLSGDLFPGIGKKTAESIIDAIGDNAITKILNDPSCLQEVPKLEKKKSDFIAETLLKNEGLEKILIGLSDYGFGSQLAMKIYQTYGDAALEMIKENPYQLIRDVEGIGFQRADELAALLGITGNHPERIQAAVLYWLNERAMNDGHVFMPYDETVQAAEKLLSNPEPDVDQDAVVREIDALEEDGRLVREDDDIYLPELYYAEKGVVTGIQKLMERSGDPDEFSESEFLEALGKVEEKLSMQYAESQQAAIRKAIQSPLMILTGGPGTGKTTVIRGIVDVYAELNGLSLNPKDYDSEHPYPVLLAAPTGRAAKRMKESTGLPAVTIHRLLGWNGGSVYTHGEDDPIEGKLLIVDEMSMVDIWLANQLLRSLPDDIKVVIVGDEDQLPSVGPGQVLSDLVQSGAIPIIRLTDIFRQARGSSIIELAHEIRQGLIPDITVPKADRRFIHCHQAQVVDAVCQIAKGAEKKGYQPKDIQVLAPIYRGNAGIEKMNEALQELFNPASDQKRSLTYGDHVFRVHDKVLQLVNNPDEQVFNGDIGEVVAILRAKETTDHEDTVVVSFDNVEVKYLKHDLNQLTLAYCCSIHKAQGSEFPIVILPIVKGYHRMLKRNLIYTAVARSKEYLMLCGDEEAFKQAIVRNDIDSRHSNLAEKLRERLHTMPGGTPHLT